jgi:hypothetical protein
MAIASFFSTLFRMGPTEEEKALIASDHMLENLMHEMHELSNSEKHIRKEALLDSLTKEELRTLELERSYDWCGTNWEDKELSRLSRILGERSPLNTA